MAAFTNDFRSVCGSRENGWLVAANVLVSVALMLAGLICGYFHVSSEWTIEFFALSSTPSEVLLHPWTVLTYMVTQYNILHLLFNTIWLLWFGRICLLTLSSVGVLKLYVAGGLCGALFYIAASYIPGVSGAGYLCGSSASVIALMAGSAVIAPDMPLRFLFGEVRLKWLAAVCILLTFLGASVSSGAGQIAHAGGLLAGLAIGWLVKTDKLSGSLLPRKTKKKRKMHTAKRGSGKTNRKLPSDAASNMRKALDKRKSDSERLDELLDKIRLSGYNSLSSMEKRELNVISKRISK